MTQFKSFLNGREVSTSDGLISNLTTDGFKSKMLEILLGDEIMSSKQATVNIEGSNIFQYQLLLCFYRSCFNHF